MPTPESSHTSELILSHMRGQGFHVSVFHNPGSLYGTVPAFVEAQAIKDGEFWMVRVYAAEHDQPEYVCVCRLAEACGFNLE